MAKRKQKGESGGNSSIGTAGGLGGPACDGTPDLSYIAEPLRHLAIHVDDLTPDPSNARKHGEKNLAAIVGSLRQFGQRMPIVVQQEGMVVRAGNGRLAAAKKLGWTHLACVVVPEDNVSAVAFAISDNRTAELAEWDDETLGKLLREVEVGDADLQQMMSDLAVDRKLIDGMDAAEVTEDEVPEPPAVPITKPGDLWMLGAYWECESCGKVYDYEQGREMKECPCG